jgi:hypothetical protein
MREGTGDGIGLLHAQVWQYKQSLAAALMICPPDLPSTCHASCGTGGIPMHRTARASGAVAVSRFSPRPAVFRAIHEVRHKPPQAACPATAR